MRKRDYVVRFLLIVMIILSVVLTLNISLNAGENTSSKNGISPKANSSRSMSELLLPTEYFFHKENHIYEITKESKITGMMHRLKEIHFTEKHSVESLSLEEINKLRQYNEGVELYYFGQLSLPDFNDAFSLQIDTSLPDFKFNWILINLSKKEMTFINDIKHQSYTLMIHDEDKIREKLPVSHGIEVTMVDDKYLNYLPKEDQEIPVYRYLLSTQPYNIFTQSFLKNPNSIGINEEDTHSLFEGDQDEVLKINGKTGVASLTLPVDQSMKGSPLSIASDMVSRLGNDFGKLRYYTNDDKTVVFRVFVEGYPIFSDYFRGQVDIEINASYIKLFTNQLSVYTPVVTQEVKKVESGKSLINKLTKKGISMDRIKNIQLGYDWKVSDTKETVSLYPQWYIQYDHQFMPVSELLKGEI